MRAHLHAVPRRRSARALAAFVGTVAVALFWPAPAAAYLNPDSGSLLLQVLLGGAAGLGVAFKLLWHRIVGRFSRRPPPEPRVEQ
ncbi:MAG TPA: hypothetical protein VD838_19930 [Anaeromyxobacteraceae bacterium]|nr:hypothetical protein [Anaeromyxobacteraceae bacterium]